MVAIFTGNGTGIERSSAMVLGSRGTLGQAAMGRAHDNVYVNAANGNLLIQNIDEMLIGLGPGATVSRTYNSQGAFNDDNGDNWRPGIARKIGGLTGTLNAVNSTIKRTDWDGSETVYKWDTTASAYVCQEGEGAYDKLTITYSGGTWTWRDGNSRITELYDDANGGRLTSSYDLDGNARTFSYNGSGLVSRVTTSSGEYTDLVYTGTQLTRLETYYQADGSGPLEHLTRVRYGYDGSGRLSTVTVDLTPEDNSVSDSVAYVTTYGYDSSNRVNSVGQTDGSALAVTYTTDNKVASLTQTSATGETRVTTFAYNTPSAGKTTITDASGQATILTYNASGQLTRIDAPPAYAGAAAQVIAITYNTRGDVTVYNPGATAAIAYAYDTSGNLLTERDYLGNTVARTYGSNNERLTETRYVVPDPDAGGASLPSSPMTTRYAYDAENHLRYVVTAEGRVTEYRYDAEGRRTSVIEYAATTYDVSSLTESQSISETSLNGWRDAITDKTTTKRTDTAYDFRGNISSVTSFGVVLSSGAGDTSATTEITTVAYVYDQAGNLLSRTPSGGSSETFVYDGLNRIKTSTNYNGQTTSVVFNDTSSTTVVTLANGLTQTSVYNLAGELIGYTEAGTGVATATTSYKYDAMGRLRIIADATGVKSYILYDRVGRKVAEIQGDGSVTEFGYDAKDRLVKTVRYKTLLDSTQLASLVDGSGNPAAIELVSVRPASDAADIWEWRIYDNANRLIEIIDGGGGVVFYTYDGASRLTSVKTSYNVIAAATVTGYKTTTPTTLRYPTASATNDRTIRYFYDNDSRLTGTLDGEGYLTQVVYDAAGQTSQSMAYATATDSSLWAGGTLSDLLTSAGTSSNDIHSWLLYDARGLLRASVNGEGDLTRFHYTALGHVDQVIVGQKLDPSTLISTPPTLAGLPSASGGTVLETTTFTRNLYGQVLTEVRTLASGSETDTYSYDVMGRLTAVTTASGSSDPRTATQRYDLRGRLVGALSGEGSAALAALGSSPTQSQIDDIYARWGVQYVYDDADRLISTIQSNGTDAAGLKSLYYYGTDGHLTHAINALGEVVEYRYDAFGRRTDVYAYASRLSSGTLAGLSGGLVTAGLTSAISAIANASVDSRHQLAYNVTGTVSSSTDAEGASTTYTYDGFRELLVQTDPISSGVTRQTTYTYDRRGLLTSSKLDSASGGLQLLSSVAYDAFGRALSTTDPDGKVRASTYDRAGRVLTTTDPLSGVTTYTYDGRGAVLTIRDRVNSTAVTSFAYTAFNRTVTMTTPEGLVTSTVNNAHGETVSITDGAGRHASFTYDKDGALKTTTDDLSNQIQNNYDKAGRLSFTLDARGAKTSFTYDAAGRVLTRKVDDGGLNLVTTFEYDAKGQQTKVTDAAGRVTSIAFDRNGRTTTVTADPTGLAIVTKYEYDLGGRSTKVTQAYGSSVAKITQYNYDKADRLTSTQVNPAGLNLTTTYVYDKRGNVISRTDAAGKVSRFVYDSDNRLVWSVDAAGGVTRTSYDAEGRVTATLGYANMVAAGTLTSWGSTPLTETMVTTAVSTSSSDYTVNLVYDMDGRLRYSVDGLGRPAEYVYDGSGNVIGSLQYAGSITPSSWSLADVAAAISTGGLASNSANRTTRAVFDAAGRQTYSIDAAGAVTAFSYDAAGNAIKAVLYAAVYTATGDPAASAMATWVSTNASSTNDRVNRTVFDGAGRAVYSVDPESYVSELQYDAAGNVTKEIRYAATYSVSDGVTVASLAGAIGSLPGTAVVTQYAYDAAGRLTDVTDALGSVTHLVMDALGQVTDSTVAYGTADAATTHSVYDAAGRMTSQTRAYGASEASTSGFTYDGMGRVLVVTNGRSFTTTRTYDGVGQVLTETVQLNATQTAVTTNQYDAFGNLVKVTDARGNAGYFYYDVLNQLTRQVDPENYVTDTTYSLGGEALTVTRFYNKATAGLGSVTTPPTTPTSHAKDATTIIGRDKLDRVTSTTDAEGFSETYTLNAFGDRVTVVGKLGGSTTNTYDKRGLLLTEVLPISSTLANGTVQATTVTNKYEYDARGNRTKATEAFGLAEARVTNFTYDKLDRLTQEIGDQVQVLASDLTTTSNVTPTQAITYDQRGNIIESIDASGARTLYYLDDLNRKTAQVSAAGTLSVWTYDAASNATSVKVYGDAVTLPGSAGGTAPSPVNSGNYRETTYAYDRNNRLISTSVASLRIGAWNGTAYATSVATVTTSLTYDQMGNVIQEVDGSGNNLFHFFDKRGRQLARVDQENYLTSYTLDAEGNVTKEERFATKVTGTVTISSDPATLRSGVVSGTLAANNRVTDFTYDRVGQRLTQTRTGVVSYSISSSTGLLSTDATSATITYAYNGLGEVTRKTEANGDYTDYTYDSLGRQLTATDSAFTDYTATSVQHRVDTFYDGLNNVTRMREGKVATDSAIDRVTTFAYGAGGRLSSTTDALGATRTYAYDALGHVVKEGYTRLKADGTTTLTEAVAYQYDVLGRTTLQASASWNGSAWTFGDKTHVRYSVYGEVTGKGITAGSASTPVYQETFEYDAGGRMWRSNAGDGVSRLHLYDAAGRVSLTVNSNGADLSGYATIETALTGLGSTYVTGAAYLAGIASTISVYDKRGQSTDTRETFRQFGGSTGTISHQRAYNAFGEVIQQTDARGYVTDFSYSTLGKLVQKQSPTVSITAEDGGVSSVRPTENYYYDLSGRLIGVEDANSNLNTRALLAGSGHGGEEVIVTAEFRAGANDSTRSGTFTTGVDVFGDARKLANELGAIETRDYDMLGRLITLTRPTRAAYSPGNPTGSAVGLTDHYVYDSLGQRVVHWNSQLGSSVKEKTDYDLQGRLVSAVDFGGAATTYAYAWNASLATTGLGTFGGLVKTTTHVSGFTATEKQDYFGRSLERLDMGGFTTTLTFDAAGRLSTQVNDVGQSLSYTYFNTGKIATIANNQNGELDEPGTATYSYDADGNRLTERYAIIITVAHYDSETGTDVYEDLEFWFQDSTVTYDGLNRMSTFSDTGPPKITDTANLPPSYLGSLPATITYSYDANGNVRRSLATYSNLVAGGTTTQDYWYKYDAMNRFVTTKGAFTGTAGSGTIARGTTGVDLAYDAASQRISATSTVSGVSRREDYVYTNDGYLATVSIADGAGSAVLRVSDVRDAMGRATSHSEYQTDGTTVAYSRMATFDSQSQVTSDVTTLKRADGKVLVSTTNYDYRAETTSGFDGAWLGGVLTHSRTTSTLDGVSQPTSDTKIVYGRHDGFYQTGITYKPNISLSTVNTSTFTYDDNFHLARVDIADGRPRTVNYVTDQDGRVLVRWEASAVNSNPLQYYYYFNGMRVGDVGNDGPSDTDYATAISRRTAIQTGPFQYGAAQSAGDFDQSYDPINANNPDAYASQYTVGDGDSLQSVALAVWGDAALWYLIADANGLTSADSLAAGMTLIIPAKVANLHNTSDTFRVYDPNKAIGNTSPSTPKPPQAKGCGGFGAVLIAIIAVVVVAFVAPYLTEHAAQLFANIGLSSTVTAEVAATTTLIGSTTIPAASAAGIAGMIAGGAAAAAVGSIVSQGVGVATGLQDKFSWNAVAMAAISGGVGGGLSASGAFATVAGSATVGNVVRGAVSSTVTQGIAVATGMQDRFDWASVAVNAIASGVTGALGRYLNDRLDARVADQIAANPSIADSSDFAGQIATAASINNAVSGMAGGIAGAAARSLVEGSDFGDNLLAALPDIIGNTIGNMIAGGLAAKSLHEKAASKSLSEKVQSGSKNIPDVQVSSTQDGLLHRAGFKPSEYRPLDSGQTLPNGITYNITDGARTIEVLLPNGDTEIRENGSDNLWIWEANEDEVWLRYASPDSGPYRPSIQTWESIIEANLAAHNRLGEAPAASRSDSLQLETFNDPGPLSNAPSPDFGTNDNYFTQGFGGWGLSNTPDFSSVRDNVSTSGEFKVGAQEYHSYDDGLRNVVRPGPMPYVYMTSYDPAEARNRAHANDRDAIAAQVPFGTATWNLTYNLTKSEGAADGVLALEYLAVGSLAAFAFARSTRGASGRQPIAGYRSTLEPLSRPRYGTAAERVAIPEAAVSRAAHPEAAQHILDAQAAGHPVELTIDRAGAVANRNASLQGLNKVPGRQLDEYPPAMFKEGGVGASVRPISPADNMGSGASIGNQIRKLPDGSKVRIIVKD